MSRRGPVIGVPWSFTSPRLAGSNPARIFRSVDLPQPEGPTTATNSPSATLKSMPSSARTVPRGVAYSLRKSLTQITSAERPMAPEVYQASARPVSYLREGAHGDHRMASLGHVAIGLAVGRGQGKSRDSRSPWILMALYSVLALL